MLAVAAATETIKITYVACRLRSSLFRSSSLVSLGCFALSPRSAESDRFAVAHRRMATHAARCRAIIRPTLRVHEVRMAAKAVAVQDVRVLLLDHDGFVEVLERERLGVVPAVRRFCDVLANEIRRQVAVDAGRRDVVTGLLPGVVLWLHDVAVGAGRWIRAEIGHALRISERHGTHSEENSETDGGESRKRLDLWQRKPSGPPTPRAESQFMASIRSANLAGFCQNGSRVQHFIPVERRPLEGCTFQRRPRVRRGSTRTPPRDW